MSLISQLNAERSIKATIEISPSMGLQIPLGSYEIKEKHLEIHWSPYHHEISHSQDVSGNGLHTSMYWTAYHSIWLVVSSPL